jgi:hypothetical protein
MEKQKEVRLDTDFFFYENARCGGKTTFRFSRSRPYGLRRATSPRGRGKSRVDFLHRTKLGSPFGRAVCEAD